MLKKKTILFISIYLIISVIIILSGVFYIKCGIRTSKYRIIKNFNKNKELFEEVIIELERENDDMHFRKKGNVILVDIHKHDGEKVNVIRFKEDELDKYAKTMELVRKFDIEQISKFDWYIDLLFKSALSGGKYIVYLKDIDNYTYGHKIREKEQITEYWYYIELPGL